MPYTPYTYTHPDDPAREDALRLTFHPPVPDGNRVLKLGCRR